MTRAYATRPRMIPPELVNDERIEECSLLAALLAVRLVTLADDQNRLPGSARHVRGIAFAMRPDVSEAQVDEALHELAGVGFLLRYDDGRTYVQVVDWWSLQRLRRAYESRYPAPPGWIDRVFETPGQAEEDVPAASGEVPAVRAEVPTPRAHGEAKTGEAKSGEARADKPGRQVASRSREGVRGNPSAPPNGASPLDAAALEVGGFAARHATDRRNDRDVEPDNGVDHRARCVSR